MDVRGASGAVLTDRTVTWTTSDPTAATVSALGLVTANRAGSATISATAEGESGAATVTVNAGPAATVAVGPASASIQVDQTVQLTATATDANGDIIGDRPVAWTSADPTVASVSSSGLVTGLTAGGPVAVSATLEGKAASTVVTVNPGSAGAVVTITPSSALVHVSRTVQLTATAVDAQGNVIVDRPVTWRSASPSVASVSSSGLVTGLARGGPVAISATVDGKTGSASVTVEGVPVATVGVSPASASIQVDQTIQLTATAMDANGQVVVIDEPATWASANPRVANVSSSGLVTGLAPGGPVAISATVDGKTGSAAITVNPSGGAVANVAVTPPSTVVLVDQTVQLTATAIDAAGNVISGRPVSWTSADPTVAMVSSSGQVTGIKIGGPVAISATVDGKSAFTTAIVAPCELSISLLPGEFTVAQQAIAAGCAVGIGQPGEYFAVPYFAEVQRPSVSTVAELPHTGATFHLIGGTPTSATRSVMRRIRQSSQAETVRPRVRGVRWLGPDHLMPELRLVTAGRSLPPCDEPVVGSPLLVPTTRYSSGGSSGYYRDIGGPIETWRVALITPAAVIAVDSAFWLRLPNAPSAQAGLASLAHALEDGVLPTMARFGIGRQDLNGDGRTLLLVPETPSGATAYAGVWNWANCSPGPEGILLPTSRFQSGPAGDAGMADAVNVMMHEMFHLYEYGIRPQGYAWYASEGTARLAEHAWRVATSSGGSPYTGRRTALPVGSYAGQSQRTTTPEVYYKHCVDPTLDGFDYLRVRGNIRAYDTGCWFSGRLAAKLEARGVPENGIFPALVRLANQRTMVEMWNEVTGESHTPESWRARWLAAMALEGSGVPPREAAIRDPMWDLASIIRNSAYATGSRFHFAPTLYGQTMPANLDIIDASARPVRLHVLAGSRLVVRDEAGEVFGSASPLQLLLVRLN